MNPKKILGYLESEHEFLRCDLTRVHFEQFGDANFARLSIDGEQSIRIAVQDFIG